MGQNGSEPMGDQASCQRVRAGGLASWRGRIVKADWLDPGITIRP